MSSACLPPLGGASRRGTAVAAAPRARHRAAERVRTLLSVSLGRDASGGSGERCDGRRVVRRRRLDEHGMDRDGYGDVDRSGQDRRHAPGHGGLPMAARTAAETRAVTSQVR